MSNQLNYFETSILNVIAADYPFLHEHIERLKIKNRKKTGVGMYINFVYKSLNSSLKPIHNKLLALSSNSYLNMKGLKNGLVYELSITDGKIEYLEIVTIGEETWDGTIHEFWFSEQ